jgi:hypothetical protein
MAAELMANLRHAHAVLVDALGGRDHPDALKHGLRLARAERAYERLQRAKAEAT